MKKPYADITEIVADMLSKDPVRIWSASSTICSLSQDQHSMKKLIPYITQFTNTTKGIELGGALAPNKRFLDKALCILNYYKEEKGCPCCLLGEDSNPLPMVEQAYFELLDSFKHPDQG